MSAIMLGGTILSSLAKKTRCLPVSAKRCMVRTRAVRHENHASMENMETGTMTDWDRLSLLKRQLAIAIEEEDFPLAATYRDESSRILSTLPWQQAAQRELADMLVDPTTSPSKRREALRKLAQIGTLLVSHEVAALLRRPDVAAEAELTLRALFLRHEDIAVNELMTTGCALLQSGENHAAIDVFARMIDLDPNFAEAYNKRATALFLSGKWTESLEDCRAALKLNPLHFGALSGMGLIYLNLDDQKKALEYFELAMDVHPGLKAEAIGKYASVLRSQLVEKRRSSSGSGDVDDVDAAAC